MARPRKTPFNGADPARFDHDGDGKPGGSLPHGQPVVKVIVADAVSDGRGGYFAVGEVIGVTPEQAAGLRRQGFAE